MAESSRLVVNEANLNYLREQFRRLMVVKFAGDPNKQKRNEFKILDGLLTKYKEAAPNTNTGMYSIKLSRQELKITQQILEATLKGLTERTIPTYTDRLNKGESKYTIYLAKCAGLVAELTTLNQKIGALL